MSVEKTISKLNDIETSVERLFNDLLSCLKDSDSPFIIAPLNHNEVYRISAWFDLSFSDFFSSLMQLFLDNKRYQSNTTSIITQVSNRIHSLIDNIYSARGIWNDIISSRQSIYEQYF